MDIAIAANNKKVSTTQLTKKTVVHDIDCQLTDLEQMIKHFKEEIDELCSVAAKRAEKNELKHDNKRNKKSDIELHGKRFAISDKTSTLVNITDNNITLSDQPTLFLEKPAIVFCVSNTNSEIRRNFDILWGDECDDEPRVNKQDWKKEIRSDIQTFINELKSEIIEKLEDLNDVGKVLNNSDEEII